MKKVVAGFTLVVLFCFSGFVWAQLGGLLGKKDTPKVDAEGLSARSVAVMTLVKKASIYYAEAVAAMHEAVGNKKTAEQLKQNIADLNSKPGLDSTKVLVSNTDNAAKEVNSTESMSKLAAEDAQKFVGKSILNVGTGVLLDGLAVQNAGPLLNEAQGALKQAPITSAGKIKDVVAVGQFVTQDVPPRVTAMKSFSEKLIEYGKTKGISISPEEIQQKYNAEKG